MLIFADRECWAGRYTEKQSTKPGAPSCGSRCAGGREGAGKWELEREHWGDCRAGGAAGTDATSGSLQKAGLQQGWMLTALSGPLSRDSFKGRFPWALS